MTPGVASPADMRLDSPGHGAAPWREWAPSAGGAAIGLAAWLACAADPPVLPTGVRFYVTEFALIFGCGALPLWFTGATIGRAERTALACAFGTAIAPLLICICAVCRVAFIFPPLAFAATGFTAARWFGAGGWRRPSRDAWWYVLLPLGVFAIGAWISAGRFTRTSDGFAIFGDYETFDLTYYAAIASELGHTTVIPPASPFFAGHRIIYSYFPLMLLAAVHKVTGVGLTATFVALGWPLFTAIAAATVFVLCRQLGSTAFAVVTTILVCTGSSLAYVAAWFWPSMVALDPLIWSSMLLAPSAEWLFFNPWAPALTLVCAGVYALNRAFAPPQLPWSVVASGCFGLVFMVKSFALPVTLAALGMTSLVLACRRDWRAAARTAAIAAGAVLWAAPWLAAILPYNQVENRGARVTVEWLSLVRRMLMKTGLTAPIEDSLRYITATPTPEMILLVASVIFLVGGLGMRCIGLGTVVRAAIGDMQVRRFMPLAWIAIIGTALSFVFAVAPFPNSIQTYMFALFVLWPFAVWRIWPAHARPTPRRLAATVALIALSIPSTVHYVLAAHDAARGEAIANMTEGDFKIVRYLQRTDRATTLVAHSDPLWPSLYALESGRRVVLAWSSYVEGDGSREVKALSDHIARFFGSAESPGIDDLGLLRHYGVTHVIERLPDDQLHPNVRRQLRLVTGTPTVRLYEVPRPQNTES